MAKRPRPHRPICVSSIVGFGGVGKTRFLTTAPWPIQVVSHDTNTEETIRDVLGIGDGDIAIHHCPMPSTLFGDGRDDIEAEAGEKWESIIDLLRPMLKKDNAPATLALDTATDTYDLRVLAQFGKLDQIHPEQRKNMMGRCNSDYKGLIAAFKDAGVQVLLIHRAKELWADRTVRTQQGIKDERYKLTGPFDVERDAFKGTPFITNIEVVLAFDPDRKVKESLNDDAKAAARFGMQITRSTARPMLIRETYWGREKLDNGTKIARVSYPYLMVQNYPTTTLSDWR